MSNHFRPTKLKSTKAKDLENEIYVSVHWATVEKDLLTKMPEEEINNKILEFISNNAGLTYYKVLEKLYSEEPLLARYCISQSKYEKFHKECHRLIKETFKNI